MRQDRWDTPQLRVGEGGISLLKRLDELSHRTDTVSYPMQGANYFAPILDPQKIICIGLNYRDHATEQNIPLPREPVIFSKFATALTGHGQLETFGVPREARSISPLVRLDHPSAPTAPQDGRRAAPVPSSCSSG